jgi:hypothetical protein
MASETQRGWNNSGRNARPLNHYAPKLTAQQRYDISQRLADGENPTDLALEYGVSARRIRELR